MLIETFLRKCGMRQMCTSVTELSDSAENNLIPAWGVTVFVLE
jgi:hypothetical protein